MNSVEHVNNVICHWFDFIWDVSLMAFVFFINKVMGGGVSY